jgi:hypothetical protein
MFHLHVCFMSSVDHRCRVLCHAVLWLAPLAGDASEMLNVRAIPKATHTHTLLHTHTHTAVLYSV